MKESGVEVLILNETLMKNRKTENGPSCTGHTMGKVGLKKQKKLKIILGAHMLPWYELADIFFNCLNLPSWVC